VPALSVSVFVVPLIETLLSGRTAELAIVGIAGGSSLGRWVGWVEMTPPSPTLTPPLPPANENCLPRKEPVNPLPVPLPLPVPGPALLGTLPGPLLVSLAVLPRFLLAISYMSPKIPAKVFLRFFMVSSASDRMPMADRQSLVVTEVVMVPVVGATMPALLLMLVMAVMPLASPASVAVAPVFVVFVSIRVMVSTEVVLP